jgi:alpha-mannosidase
VPREALSLNSPLVFANGGPEPAEYGFIEAEGVELALGALKPAEDGRGKILRLYEPHGARGECTLRFARCPESVRRTNLLEEPEGTVEVSDGAVRLAVRPFEVVTLLIEWEKDIKIAGEAERGAGHGTPSSGAFRAGELRAHLRRGSSC